MMRPERNRKMMNWLIKNPEIVKVHWLAGL
jgi:hypothetical protein